MTVARMTALDTAGDILEQEVSPALERILDLAGQLGPKHTRNIARLQDEIQEILFRLNNDDN